MINLKNYIKLCLNESTEENQAVNVVAAVIIRDSKILILQRGETAPWMPQKWNLPGGMVDSGETTTRAVVREIKEETSIVIGEEQVESIGYFDGKSFMLETFKTFTNSQSLPENVFDYDKRKSLLPISEELGFSESMDYVWINRNEIGNYDFVPTVSNTLIEAFKTI